MKRLLPLLFLLATAAAPAAPPPGHPPSVPAMDSLLPDNLSERTFPGAMFVAHVALVAP